MIHQHARLSGPATRYGTPRIPLGGFKPNELIVFSGVAYGGIKKLLCDAQPYLTPAQKSKIEHLEFLLTAATPGHTPELWKQIKTIAEEAIKQQEIKNLKRQKHLKRFSSHKSK